MRIQLSHSFSFSRVESIGRIALCAFAAASLLSACGGSSSESPMPLEPVPHSGPEPIAEADVSATEGEEPKVQPADSAPAPAEQDAAPAATDPAPAESATSAAPAEPAASESASAEPAAAEAPAAPATKKPASPPTKGEDKSESAPAAK
jgi:hypothetical protein